MGLFVVVDLDPLPSAVVIGRNEDRDALQGCYEPLQNWSEPGPEGCALRGKAEVALELGKDPISEACATMNLLVK